MILSKTHIAYIIYIMLHNWVPRIAFDWNMLSIESGSIYNF